MSEPNIIEINEPVVETKKEEFTTEGLSAPEIELAKKTGLLKEPEEKKDEKKEANADKVEPKDEKEDSEKLVTFEDVETNEKLLDKYSKNEKALYWKWKNDKRKRQDAVAKVDELKAELELKQVKDNLSNTKLKKIKEVLASDDVTVEKINAIIGDIEEAKEKAEEKKEPNEKVAQSQQERLMITEKVGLSIYPNFEQAAKLADEVVKSDKTGTYGEILQKAFLNEDIDPQELVERIMNIARLNPSFGKLSEKKEKKEVEVTKDARKVVSSAALPSGSGKRNVVEDDLTVEDAAKLTTSQWLKLKKETRERLLRGM